MWNLKLYYNVLDRNSIECHSGVVAKLKEEHDCSKWNKILPLPTYSQEIFWTETSLQTQRIISTMRR